MSWLIEAILSKVPDNKLADENPMQWVIIEMIQKGSDGIILYSGFIFKCSNKGVIG